MPYFRKLPVTVIANRWFRNGDHPDDFSDRNPEMSNIEGMVVRYYRHPDVPGDMKCKYCGRIMHDHGWIDTMEGGHIVCPGDWIITGVKGENYPCKPGVFAATYEEVDQSAPVKPVVDDAMVERARNVLHDRGYMAVRQVVRAALVAALEGRT